MISKKTCIKTFLVLCTIYTSESRHLANHHDCGCSDTESDTTKKPNHDTQHEYEPHKIYGKLINTKLQSIENKKPVPGVSRGYDHQSIPMQYYEQNIASDENVPWNLLSNLAKKIPLKDPNHLNDDPRLTEGLLKQIWLSHQIGKVPVPQSQNPNFNTEIRQNSILEIPLAIGIDIQNTNIPSLQVIPLDEYDVDKQEAIISPQRIKQFAAYGADNQKTNIPSLRVIPQDEYGGEQKRDVHYSADHRKYVNYDHSVPYKYDSKAIPDNEFRSIKGLKVDEFRSNHYYDVPKLVNQRYNLPVYQQNFDNNESYKYNLKNIFDEIRSPISTAYISPHNIPSTQRESGNLCGWVLEQTEMIDSKNQGLENVDPSSVGYSVLQSLCESGMYITNNGILVDTYGTALSLDSLNLTPIIIGSPVSLRQSLEGKHEGVSLKLQTPYIEAILVSATQPLKILGIKPLATSNLPAPTLSSVANIGSIIPNDLKSRKSGEDKVVDENGLEQDEPENPEATKSEESKRDNTGEIYNNPVRSSKNVNVNGNNNSIGLSRRLKITPSRRGLRPDDEDRTDDRPYSKQFEAINKEESESDGGRIFIPRIKVQEQPIDITLTRRRNFPVSVIASNSYKPARIHVPSISSFLDIAFRSAKTPAKSDKNTKSNGVTEISDSLVEISGDVEKSSETTEPLTKLNLLKDEILLSIGEEIEPNRLLKKFDDNANPLLTLNTKGLQAMLDKTDLSKITQYLPYLEKGVGSRSGDELDSSEIPPQNVHIGNSPFDLVKNDDDDDDGDFRIIGGNAATGSGTPLSNRGRSGYVY